MFDENKYYSLLNSLDKDLPKRIDGSIDYTNATKAAVITIFIKYENKILILKRSDQVLTYKGKWNTVAGYLDQVKPIMDKVYEELREEVGISKEDINMFYLGDSYSFEDNYIEKIWIIYPILVILEKKPEIILDWEHTDYKWIEPSMISSYNIVPNMAKSLEMVIKEFESQ